jgi:hypothetical protein
VQEQDTAYPYSSSRHHDDTVIIFDWDDTLLCTSALRSCEPEQLDMLGHLAKATLELALRLGTTIIVTNATDGWVQRSASIFMPNLLPTLRRIPILSAREVHQDVFPDDALAWKRETFCELLRRKRACELNLIVLGDSIAEIQAADAVGKILGHIPLVKTVKFKPEPSSVELLSQLRVLACELRKLVEEGRSISKAFVPEVDACRTRGACRWTLTEVSPRSGRLCTRAGSTR